MSNDPGAADYTDDSGPPPYSFWLGALLVRGSVTPRVFRDVLSFGVLTAAIVIVCQAIESLFGVRLHVGVGPFQAAGAVLGLLLVLRTNAGYDRWWEARKLWGGIVNQSRNLAITALAYGPTEPAWRIKFIRWAAAFPHVVRRSLRGERNMPEVARLLGEAEVKQITTADHMPGVVSRELAAMLRVAEASGMSHWAFQEAERQRGLLVDHLGGCERILKTPLARSTAIQVRRFIFLFLVTLPFSLLRDLRPEWGALDIAGVQLTANVLLIPLFIMLMAYPLLALDRIGMELQNPFDRSRIDHLPLDRLCMTIEGNLVELLRQCSAPEDTALMHVVEPAPDALITQTFHPFQKDVS